MKAVREWIKDLDEDIRIKFEEYAKQNYGDLFEIYMNNQEGSLSSVLHGAFKWNKTEEGFDFWNDLYNCLENEDSK